VTKGAPKDSFLFREPFFKVEGGTQSANPFPICTVQSNPQAGDLVWCGMVKVES